MPTSELRALEAERGVLGSMLRDSSRIRAVSAKMREEDLALEIDRQIYAAMLRMDVDGRGVDGLTVADEIKATKEVREYLGQLLELAPTAVHAEEYAEIVAAAGKRRRLREALREAMTAIDEDQPDDAILPILDNAISAHDEASQNAILSPTEQIKSFLTYRARIDSGEKPYTRTGLKSLDKLLGGGLRDENLYFLAARPGTGKTALGLCVADFAAGLGQKVLFISLEMSNEEIMARRFSAATRVDNRLLLMNALTSDEMQRVAESVAEMEKKPVYVTAQSLSAPQIVSLARAHRGLRLVIIDHFTLIKRPGIGKSFDEYAEIAHTLQRLAKAIKAPVLCLIQVNREGDQRKGTPGLSDLRGSGSTEEDAAGVLILTRDNESEEKREESEPIPETIYLAKNRFGPSGKKIRLSFWPQTNTFRETYAK